MGDNRFTKNTCSLSRGQLLVNLAQQQLSDVECEDVASIVDEISICSSPPPSLTELKAVDPTLIDDILLNNEDWIAGVDGDLDSSCAATGLLVPELCNSVEKSSDFHLQLILPHQKGKTYVNEVCLPVTHEAPTLEDTLSSSSSSNPFPDNDIDDPDYIPDNYIDDPNIIADNDKDDPNYIPDNYIDDPNNIPDNYIDDPNNIPDNYIDVPNNIPDNDKDDPNDIPDNYIDDPNNIPDNDIDDPNYIPDNDIDDPNYIPKDSIALVPYSDSEDDSNNRHENIQKIKSRKRVRCEENWKRNVRKNKRVSGKQYTNSKGATIGKKSLKPPCKETCRLKCNLRISNGQRLLIHRDFWKGDRSWDSKRQFIVSSIKIKPVARRRDKDGSRKEKRSSQSYCFIVNSQEEIVCKPFFLNTLSISETFMRIALNKNSINGMIESDLRGKHKAVNKTPEPMYQQIKEHILKYPSYQSHYSRERTEKKYLGSHLNISKMYFLYTEECKEKGVPFAKKWLFYKIFNEDFNLSFNSPDNDTCDVCDKNLTDMKNKSGEELDQIKKNHEEHLEEASLRYKIKKEDKQISKNDNTSRVVMVDLEKCLPTPNLTNSQSFYLRKLWTLNYTIHDNPNDKTWCMLWDEVTAGRGGNEMASCLYSWAVQELTISATDKLTVWSDNCSGQNRNINMVLMYIWLLKTIPHLTEINHKYLLAGHTHMEVDGQHSIIERAKNNQISHSVFTCNDWVNFIANCKKKNPFIVQRMNFSDFLDFLSLTKTRESPYMLRKLNTDVEPFLISTTVWLQLRKENMGVLYYKTNFKDADFKKVDLRRMPRRNGHISIPLSIPPIRLEKKKISSLKYKDLMTLLQWVPDEYKLYFQSMPHGDNEPDFPE